MVEIKQAWFNVISYSPHIWLWLKLNKQDLTLQIREPNSN